MPGIGLISLGLVAAVVMIGPVGCRSNRPVDTGTLLVDIRDPKLSTRTKLGLIGQTPELVEAGELDRSAAIEALKDIIWSRRLPSITRERALHALLDEGGLLSADQGEQLVAQLLPTETDKGIVLALSKVAVLRHWVGTTPALVRAFAKPDVTRADDQRPEGLALLELHPDQSIEEIVFETFLASGPTSSQGQHSRIRRDAWNLLSRLDASGEMRVDLLSGLIADEELSSDDPTLSALRRGLVDLHTIPLTGEELQWLTRLASDDSASGRTWWEETRTAVQNLPPERRRGLRLRHMEALRWAAKYRTAWANASIEDLRAELDSRLEPRSHHRRLSDVVRFRSESLDTWGDAMVWADFLTALVIDDAIRQDHLEAELFDQADADRSDTTTEYGGIIRISLRRGREDQFVAAMYPPRPVMRENDTSFVASPEMLIEGGRAVAHYHFHVQRVGNGQYAGPSDGDMLYAARYGRDCLVFTSIDKDTLAVDLYQPDGVVLDLGDISIPEKDGP